MSAAGKIMDERIPDSDSDEMEFENADVEEAEDRVMEVYAKTGRKVSHSHLKRISGNVNPLLLSQSVIDRATDDKTKAEMLASKI